VTATYATDDLLAAEVYTNPYDYFGWLRETDPVHWNPLYRSWVVTRHSDVVWLIRHHELFSSELPLLDPRQSYPPIDEADWEVVEALERHGRNLISADRPEHLAMRRTVHRWFTPSAVERWRAELARTVQRLIDARRADGGMELKSEFATPLPLKTICLMLGVPEEDAAHLKDLAVAFASAFAVVGAGYDPNLVRESLRAHGELEEYFSPLVAARAKDPGNDLISLLADGMRRGVFTRDECLENVILLLIAGHETTLNLITNGALAFIRSPSQWDLLQSDPARMCEAATEECLRYEPSIPLLVRVTTQDLELGGIEIGAGTLVHWVTCSANRDPRAFSDPDRFDITRSPNAHVAFGGGIHHCLGAALARVEAQEAFKGLAENLPRLYLEEDEVEYLPSIEFRSVRSLNVSWG